MSNPGGFAVTRNRSGDRFYNPPPVRRHQQLLLQQQKQLERPVLKENQVDLPEAEARTDSNESTLSRPNSVRSASPPRTANLTNLDRLMESVTPLVPAQYPEARSRRRRTHEADVQPFFCLGDLWESFKEWSAYGVGVPLLLNGSDSVMQYYVPFLSGMQLYVDSQGTRKPSEESDAESSRETSSVGSSDCEARAQHNIMNWNSERINGLALRERQTISSSSDETELPSSPGLLAFQYLEEEQPFHRKPLYDKVSTIASKFPEIRIYSSSDLLPESWICVAWYPIYRIPMGPTLQNLDASFLSFHSLSTHSRSKNHMQFHNSSGRKAFHDRAFSKVSLPVFGLASYKLKGSVLSSNEADERQQANSLLQAADNWLQGLQVKLPDFQFFVSHGTQGK
ncbi:hypothetical protein HS088_TW18G00090 [Tripterygium wilfordii]|uniref:DUF789 family protein n=1 Tax=Tripterygium wilfordii TaxID=458696 RepID=A0A7J7CB98_TRIWF|nr:uncharacterized protein LOC119984573 [Tripterygium wilfordii]KAF5731413.1 hypothetical protein HS088_TW18G00090 [Tripterygium wilfordii]